MLPHTSISICFFQTYVVQPLVEMLFLTIQKFNFLVYPVSDGAAYSLLVLWFPSIYLDVHVVRLQLSDFA